MTTEQDPTESEFDRYVAESIKQRVEERWQLAIEHLGDTGLAAVYKEAMEQHYRASIEALKEGRAHACILTAVYPDKNGVNATYDAEAIDGSGLHVEQKVPLRPHIAGVEFEAIGTSPPSERIICYLVEPVQREPRGNIQLLVGEDFCLAKDRST